ncbi:MAG TPA: hypothetical protein ENG00_00410, partial [Candidatus Aenigmarchaeota archaeon]|nr:hypothetical protein [Candidatus Aenigmarchaeota archaeon]
MKEKNKKQERESEQKRSDEREESKKPRKAEKTKTSLPAHIEGKTPAYRLKGRFPVLETEIDNFLELIYEKKRLRLKEAVKIFKVRKETIIEWSRILEESNLIRVNYPVFGKPVFMVYEPEKKRHEKKRKEKPEKPIKKKRQRMKIKIRPKVVVIYIEIITLGLLLIYIFLVNKRLSQNLVPTILKYLGLIFSNPYVYIPVLVIPLIPVFVLRAVRKRKERMKLHKPSEKKAVKRSYRLEEKKPEEMSTKREIEEFLKTIERQYKKGIISKKLYERMKENAEK